MKLGLPEVHEICERLEEFMAAIDSPSGGAEVFVDAGFEAVEGGERERVESFMVMGVGVPGD